MTLLVLGIFIVLVAAFAIWWCSFYTPCPLCGCRATKTGEVISCDRCGDFFEFFV